MSLAFSNNSRYRSSLSRIELFEPTAGDLARRNFFVIPEDLRQLGLAPDQRQEIFADDRVVFAIHFRMRFYPHMRRFDTGKESDQAGIVGGPEDLFQFGGAALRFLQSQKNCGSSRSSVSPQIPDPRPARCLTGWGYCRKQFQGRVRDRPRSDRDFPAIALFPAPACPACSSMQAWVTMK